MIKIFALVLVMAVMVHSANIAEKLNLPASCHKQVAATGEVLGEIGAVLQQAEKILDTSPFKMVADGVVEIAQEMRDIEKNEKVNDDQNEEMEDGQNEEMEDGQNEEMEDGQNEEVNDVENAVMNAVENELVNDVNN